MQTERKSNLILGLILLFVGAWFLVAQFGIIPGLRELIKIEYQWPLIIIGVGAFLFLMGLLVRAPGMSVPASIVAGIGGILYWTSSTGRWVDWSFLWTLIPGFVGVGIILATILGREDKKSYREGIRLIFISIAMLVVFIFFFSGQGYFIRYWPVLIILAGVWIIIQAIIHRK